MASLLGFTIRRTAPPVITGADVLEDAVAALARRVNALETALDTQSRHLDADRLERADWLERLERLYARVRVRQQRAKDADEQASLLDPPEAIKPGDLASIRALRARNGR